MRFSTATIVISASYFSGALSLALPDNADPSATTPEHRARPSLTFDPQPTGTHAPKGPSILAERALLHYKCTSGTVHMSNVAQPAVQARQEKSKHAPLDIIITPSGCSDGDNSVIEAKIDAGNITFIRNGKTVDGGKMFRGKHGKKGKGKHAHSSGAEASATGSDDDETADPTGTSDDVAAATSGTSNSSATSAAAMLSDSTDNEAVDDAQAAVGGDGAMSASPSTLTTAVSNQVTAAPTSS